MLREDIYCNNYKCEKFDDCDYSTYAVPVDGKEVICTNLDDTEFCKKYELP